MCTFTILRYGVSLQILLMEKRFTVWQEQLQMLFIIGSWIYEPIMNKTRVFFSQSALELAVLTLLALDAC